jgi:molybdate transport system substrate-binding protein
MTESFKEIQKLFNTKYPSITLVFNFDSSGTLQKQVEQGAAADIFVSAAQKQVDALQKEGYINGDSVIKLLQNEVVLIVPNK